VQKALQSTRSWMNPKEFFLLHETLWFRMLLSVIVKGFLTVDLNYIKKCTGSAVSAFFKEKFIFLKNCYFKE
jgi:hypothetical protein